MNFQFCLFISKIDQKKLDFQSLNLRIKITWSEKRDFLEKTILLKTKKQNNFSNTATALQNLQKFSIHKQVHVLIESRGIQLTQNNLRGQGVGV